MSSIELASPRDGRRSPNVAGRAIGFGACLSLLAGCATGFGSPTRHARANLQAASAKIGTTMLVQGAIIALPKDDVSPKGGFAYLEFLAVNTGNQPDVLLAVTAQPLDAAGAVPSGAPASGNASASQPLLAGSIPAPGNLSVAGATAGVPGTARFTVTLQDLRVPLHTGDSVSVTIAFRNSGSVSSLFVPVQSADAVGTFLPSGVPSSAPVSGGTAAASPPPASSPAAPQSTPPTPVASTSPSPAASS